jgi:glutathione synthase/RimK-type ligase-like ATP-grasp enzyme
MPSNLRRPRQPRLRRDLSCIVVNGPSDGAIALALALHPTDVKVVRKERLAVVGRNYNRFFNWGCSSADLPQDKPVFNKPEAVASVVDKVKFFEEYGDLAKIPYVTTRQQAVELFARYRRVVCRTVTRGSSGDGIVIATNPNELVDAKLYTAYIPKKAEYRVHVVGGEVVAVQQKRARTSAEMTEAQRLVRNHANGWIYAVDNVDPPSTELLDACLAIVRESGLDYCGVDCLIASANGKPYILEINTAVGLESPTVIASVSEAIRNKFITNANGGTASGG